MACTRLESTTAIASLPGSLTRRAWSGLRITRNASTGPPNSLSWRRAFARLPSETDADRRRARLPGVPMGRRVFSRLQGCDFPAAKTGWVVNFFAFDLLCNDGWDLTAPRSKTAQKQALSEIIPPHSEGIFTLQRSPSRPRPSRFFARRASLRPGRHRLEAPATHPTAPGRGSTWLKIIMPAIATNLSLSVSRSDPEGRREGLALWLAGYYDPIGKHCATSRTRSAPASAQRWLADLRQRLDTLGASAPLGSFLPKDCSAPKAFIGFRQRWSPRVEFAGWTAGLDSIPAPRLLQGLREDKDPREVLVYDRSAATAPYPP